MYFFQEAFIHRIVCLWEQMPSKEIMIMCGGNFKGVERRGREWREEEGSGEKRKGVERRGREWREEEGSGEKRKGVERRGREWREEEGRERKMEG